MTRKLPSDIRGRAREMRGRLTDAEGLLWWKLRELNRHGWHFRRQAPFRGYYLDFVEHGANLVIELDGSQHGDAGQRDHDAVRDDVLNRDGYRVLQFFNTEVFQNLDGTVEAIYRVATARRVRPPPEKPLRDFSTSPQGGGH